MIEKKRRRGYMGKVKLSVLDMSIILKGESPSDTVRASVDFAQYVEQLGYHRYWFTEHHNTHHQISTSPAIMITHIAAHTTTIRVGAGGVMLPNHSPLRVAEEFALLGAMYPNRIDLGIGRAPGTDGLTAMALRRSREAVYRYDFPENLDELLHYFKNDFPADNPFGKIKMSPSKAIPEIFLLGSSNGSVNYAAERGLGFSFAAHMSPNIAVETLQSYRSNFKASSWLSTPDGIYACAAIVAATEEEAQRLAKPAQVFWARVLLGQRAVEFPSLEEAENYVLTLEEVLVLQRLQDSILIGSAQQIAATLKSKAERSCVDEVMVIPFYPTQASRKEGAKLLAQAMANN